MLRGSDKPLHGEIKRQRAVYIAEPPRIGIAAPQLRCDAALHSRKLRAFDEPPFR